MIIENLPNAEYHKREEISKSQLDLIAQSPSTFMWSQNLPRVTTNAFSFGDAGHTIILEPDKWDSQYVLPLDIPRRSNEEKKAHAEFAEANKNKIILDRKDYNMVLACRESIMAEPTARMIIESASDTEVSLFNEDEETGVKQKCRLDIDFLERGIIADLKFIDKIENFPAHIHNFRYHVQDAHYKSVVATEVGCEVEDLTFIFIVCGKTLSGGRHPVRVFELKERAQEIWMKLRNKDMRTYADCLKTKNWIHVSEVDLPGWVRGED